MAATNTSSPSLSDNSHKPSTVQQTTSASRFLRRGRTVLRSRKILRSHNNNNNNTSTHHQQPHQSTPSASSPQPEEPSSRSFVYRKYGNSARSLARTFLLRKEPKSTNTTTTNNDNKSNGTASFASRKTLTRPSLPDDQRCNNNNKRDVVPSHHRPRNHRGGGISNSNKGNGDNNIIDTVFVNPWNSNNNYNNNNNSEGLVSTSRLRNPGRSFLAKVARTAVSGGGDYYYSRTSEEIVAALLLLAERPDFDAAYRAVERDHRACASIWLGHCTWLFRLRSLTILSDPVWASKLDTTSTTGGARRLVAPVCSPGDLPRDIDVVMLSSSNADHLDPAAVSILAAGPAARAKWLVPLGVERALIECGVPRERIFALDWWQEVKVNGARIVCTPAQHHSATEGALWCSWSVLLQSHRLFYCGATGYRSADKYYYTNGEDVANYEHRKIHGGKACPAFKEISARFGRFDTAILPLGHYKPRPQVASYQGDPVDMLFVHRDLRTRKSLGHRWGTYAPSAGECLLDPIRELEAALVDSPVSEHDFITLRHGKLHIS